MNLNPNPEIQKKMFSIFRRKKSGAGLESTQVRPVEKTGADPLEQRLERTRSSLSGLFGLLRSASSIDEDLIEEIETTLLTADLGVTATTRIIDRLREGLRQGIVSEPSQVLPAVQAELFDLIEPCEQFLAIDPVKKPFVILMVGVNGVGKTTTIGKLARRYLDEGKSVMLAAGDTFRAAAVEQLKAWGERNQVPVVAQKSGADTAAVIYDALHSARSRGVDILIADTAGRLHTQGHLMDELAKVRRVMQKIDPEAPHETMLVVDAGTGQNALSQARQFNEAVPLTGITVTKLDGTARGGVMFAIAAELEIPIRFIGVGETAADLRPFDAGTFVHAILPVADER
jgi:fused signal recognition particle receptor